VGQRGPIISDCVLRGGGCEEGGDYTLHIILGAILLAILALALAQRFYFAQKRR
jgi:hypothetical protein